MVLGIGVDFQWAEAPLNSIWCPTIASAGYLIVVALLNYWMCTIRQGKGFDTKWLQAVHNMILCLASLGMAVGATTEVVGRALHSSSNSSSSFDMTWFFCEDQSTVASGELWFWSYLYYLSKYYELLDTVLQLLKGRPPPHFFLHVYHHSMVLFMAWSWLETVQTLQFGGLIFNTAVHVVMYYYYFRRVMKWSVPWKKYVTKFQIVQFSASLVFFMVTCGYYARGASCAGTYALAFNVFFNVTLLHQFVGVLGSGGKKKSSSVDKKKA